MTRVQRTKYDSRAVTRELRLIPRIKLVNTHVNGTRECKLSRELYRGSSEFTVPSQNQFDPSVHLTLSDISSDNRHQPRIIHITIKQSKTDPFRQGVTLSLGHTSHEICPVRAIAPFLAAQGNKPGPLFILHNGKMLTREMFGSALDRILTLLHLNKEHFNAHSFRIGAATLAKQAGMSDTHIKMLGRWRSDAYQRYVRMSPTDLAGLSMKLIPGHYHPSGHSTS